MKQPLVAPTDDRARKPDWRVGKQVRRRRVPLSPCLSLSFFLFPSSRLRRTPSTFTSCTLLVSSLRVPLLPKWVSTSLRSSPTSLREFGLSLTYSSPLPERSLPLSLSYIYFFLLALYYHLSLYRFGAPLLFRSSLLLDVALLVFVSLSISQSFLSFSLACYLSRSITLFFSPFLNGATSHISSPDSPSHLHIHIYPPVFPTRFLLPLVSRFPSLLWCPSGCSTLFSMTPTSYFSMTPYPTEVRGALFPTLAEAQPEVLACAACPSIYFSSPTLLLGWVYTCCRFYPLRAYGCVHITHRHKREMEREAEGERERTKLRRETQRPEFDSRLLTLRDFRK